MDIHSSGSILSFIFLQKSPAKKLSDALSKSLSCASSREPPYPMFSDTPEKPLNLTHVVYVNSHFAQMDSVKLSTILLYNEFTMNCAC